MDHKPDILDQEMTVGSTIAVNSKTHSESVFAQCQQEIVNLTLYFKTKPLFNILYI